MGAECDEKQRDNSFANYSDNEEALLVLQYST